MPVHPNPMSPKPARSKGNRDSHISNIPLKDSAATLTSIKSEGSSDYEFDVSAPTEVHRVPGDQVPGLTEEQKNEVFTKTITAADPNATKGLTRFDYAEGTYKPVGAVSHLAVHFSLDGFLIHRESEEAKEQLSWVEENKDRMIIFKSTGTDTNNDNNGSDTTPPMSPAAVKQTHEMETSTDDIPEGNDRALKNQFNYSERGNQTVNPIYRDRETATEPPPCVEFSGQVTAWEIFDTYCEQLEKEISIRQATEKPKKKHTDDDDEDGMHALSTGGDGDSESNLAASLNAILHSESCSLALKTMERLINQNSEAAAFHDYKYSDEAAPVVASLPAQLQSVKGTFLPLWKFQYGESLGSTVTAVSFNPLFPDLFAVSYGCYEFGARSNNGGLICAFTLKNSTHPEYIIHTPAPVQCIDWNQQHPSLLVCGMIDGTVAVYDIRYAKLSATKSSLLYLSDSPKAKHTDCVWQVKWSTPAPVAADADTATIKPLSFASISADGRVTQWILNKQELQYEDMIRLTVKIDDSVACSGGTCFAFNKHYVNQFLVGTEEGSIHLYDKSFHTTLLRSYVGHHASVYSLHFNAYHPGVFLSCSADWQVKLWESESETPVMAFDLSCPIGDIAWSPHSATRFAVVTSDGRLRVYDLAVNKYEAIGELRVNKRVPLTHVAFSSVDPLVAVGDNEGKVHLLKLSSAMRRKPWPTNDGTLTPAESLEEVKRLDRLLVLPSREDNKQPAYIRQYIGAEERKLAGEAKAKDEAKVKAQADKAKASAAGGSPSTMTSPRKAAD